MCLFACTKNWTKCLYTLVSLFVGLFYVLVVIPRFFYSYADEKIANLKKQKVISFVETPVIHHGIQTKVEFENKLYSRMSNESLDSNMY